MGEGVINIVFYITYFLIIVALIGTIIGVVVAVVQNLKDGGLAAIIGLVSLIVLFGIGYALSSGDIPADLQAKGIDGLDSIRQVGAGMIMVYAMGAIATVLLVVDIIKGFVEGL